VEPLNVKTDVSGSPYGHKILVYLLVKLYEIRQFKNKTGVLVIHTVMNTTILQTKKNVK